MALPPAACVASALSARQSLIADTSSNAYRLFNGEADGTAGLVIERLGDVLIVQLHEGRLKLDLNTVERIVRELHEQLGTRAVYQKVFPRDRACAKAGIADMHKSAEPWMGEPVEPEQVITENDLRFIVRPYDGFSYGLFLEHRNNRRRVRELAAGRRVLNAFSYTCGFSVAAAAGGAVTVASLDMFKRYLEWGKLNFAVNQIDLEAHRFFCSDVFDFYKRAQRQNRRFDLIVLDPPTFSRGCRTKDTFVLEKELEPLCAGAFGLLDAGGLIFLATNDRRISRVRLEEAMMAATSERRCTILERPSLPVDFACDPGYSKAIWAHVD